MKQIRIQLGPWDVNCTFVDKLCKFGKKKIYRRKYENKSLVVVKAYFPTLDCCSSSNSLLRWMVASCCARFKALASAFYEDKVTRNVDVIH